MQQAPLVIHSPVPKPINNVNIADQYTNLIAMIDDEMQPPSVPTPSDKPSPKVVAFQFPPEFEDRKSLCQSPSWEAYDRRKKEKRDEKKEEKRKEEERRREEKRREEERKKKEQEEEEKKKAQQNAAKKQQPAKPRRLSKPPPASAQTMDQINPASTARQPRSQKPRPNSALGLVLPGSDEGTDRSTRKRSGSFTSLIRAPFEHRRASFDQSSAGGFIGGIKLEQERFDAEQRANEANIHPALRKSKPDEARSHSPQRPPHTPTSRTEASQRRAYPPITILTASSKTRSLAAPDASRMDRFRARVGLKPAPRTASADGRLNTSTRPDVKPSNDSNTSLPTYESSVEKTSQSKESPPKSPGLTPAPLKLKTNNLGGPRRNINEKQLNIKIPQKDEGRTPEVSAKSSPMTPKDHSAHGKAKDTKPTLSDLIAQEGQGSTSLLPPLRPPRKSSKRSLATNSSASSPSTATPTPRLPSATTPPTATDSPQDFLGLFNAPYSPPSLELNPEGVPPVTELKSRFPEDFPKSTDQVNSFGISTRRNDTTSKNASNDASARRSPERRSKDSARPLHGKPVADDQSTKNKPSRRPPLVSERSDHSLNNATRPSRPLSRASGTSSEDLQYHSPMSTPGTSYPQSEKELTPVPTDTELGPALGDRRKSTQLRHQLPAPEDLPLPPVYARHHQRKPSQRSDIEEDIELDRIQAAARKVMAAFPPGSPPRADRRTQSDPDVAASAGFLPKLKLRKEKSKLGQVTGAKDLEKSDGGRRPLLGHVKAKSAVNLPHISKPQLAPPSPALSPMSLPTPTFHPPHSSTSSLDVSSKRLLQPSPGPRTSTDSRGTRPSMDSSRDGGAPVAKMFVECCSCRYYHDMPSRLYEAMVNPEAVLAPGDVAAYKGSVSMTVRCPWCQHDMSTKCCAGLAAMVYVKERLH